MTDELPDWFRKLLQEFNEKNKRYNSHNRIIIEYLKERIKELEGNQDG